MSQTISCRTDEKTRQNYEAILDRTRRLKNLKKHTLILLWFLPLLYLASVCLGDQLAAPPGASPQGTTVTFNDFTVPFASGRDNRKHDLNSNNGSTELFPNYRPFYTSLSSAQTIRLQPLRKLFFRGLQWHLSPYGAFREPSRQSAYKNCKGLLLRNTVVNWKFQLPMLDGR